MKLSGRAVRIDSVQTKRGERIQLGFDPAEIERIIGVPGEE